MSWTAARLSVRRLIHAPLFTLVTLVTLAVGIGANTAMFSVVYGVLLKPLPFAEPDRLISLWHIAPGMNIQRLNMSPSTYFTYKDLSRTFQSVGIWQGGAVTVTGGAEPERVRVLRVTSDILPTLGVTPASGRAFTAEDDAPSAVPGGYRGADGIAAGVRRDGVTRPISLHWYPRRRPNVRTARAGRRAGRKCARR